MSTDRTPTKAQAREAAKNAAYERGDDDLLGDEFIDDMRSIAGLPPRIDFSDRVAVEGNLRAILGRSLSGPALEQAISENLQALYGSSTS